MSHMVKERLSQAQIAILQGLADGNELRWSFGVREEYYVWKVGGFPDARSVNGLEKRELIEPVFTRKSWPPGHTYKLTDRGRQALEATKTN